MIERVNGAYVLSEFVGEGAGEYLFTRTYYGYTLKQARAQFKIALEGEGK
jgi:ribosomal protein S19